MNKFWVHFFEHSIRELCQGKRRTRHIFAKFIIHSTGEKWGKIFFKDHDGMQILFVMKY